MSVYRKNKDGELVKVAGSLTQRINMPMLRTEHIVENNADYYVIDPIQAASYINRLADNTYYLLYLEEANETPNVYIKLNEQSLKIALGASSVIPINKLYGRVDLFTLEASATGTIQLAAFNGNTTTETPGSISADQLTNIIDNSDTIVRSLDETGSKIKLNLATSITDKLSRVLVEPVSKPLAPELVGIGTDGMQTMIELGTGLEIVNGKLVSTVSAQLGEINQILDDINGEVV